MKTWKYPQTSPNGAAVPSIVRKGYGMSARAMGMSVRAMKNVREGYGNVREGNGNYAPPIIVEQEISPWLLVGSHGLIYISVVTLLL